MKRLGVAGIIRSGGKHSLHLLMGRRGKDPNRGLYVLPGGGVEDGESLEDAFCREVFEETGLKIKRDDNRWTHLLNVVETPDRVILVAHASIECRWQAPTQNHYGGYFDDEPKDGGDLYDVKWFPISELPRAISPVVTPVLSRWGFHPGKNQQ